MLGVVEAGGDGDDCMDGLLSKESLGGLPRLR